MRVVICGGGVIGACAACFLSCRWWRNTLRYSALRTVLIPRSLRRKRLEGWTQRLDSRPSFETRARARSSSDNGEAVAQG